VAGVHHYVGSELGLFAQAVHWKRYLQRQLAGFIHGHVLEVGAGMGGTTRVLRAPDCLSWTCLEPDPGLAGQIVPALQAAAPTQAEALTIIVGMVADLPEGSAFDTILYIDVLEHIENDGEELQQAAALLRTGGHLVVVAPAHQWLYSPFDKAIGHWRRYNRRTLRQLTPTGLALRRLRYVDSVGLLASLGNRLLLKSRAPTGRQVAAWDKLMVPLSRVFDVAFGYRIGKSVSAVWQRP
jgi:SAM-dependent methyltransferase